MRFYLHYKNKPYRFHGIAKHSETLESLVVYECLYPNDLGKLWVRPERMFFEDIEVQAKMLPRFRKVPLMIEESASVDANALAIIQTISAKAFKIWDAKVFEEKLQGRPSKDFHLLIGSIEGEPVAYKLGYPLSSENFYSWMGAVLPQYHGLGFAAQLMQQQHQWCSDRKFLKITTKTKNGFDGMLILNLKFGFEVSGVEKNKILLQKVL